MLADVAPGDDSPRHCTRFRNDGAWDRPLDDTVLQDAKDAITDKTPMSLSYKVRNINRSIGARVSGEIGYQRGHAGPARRTRSSSSSKGAPARASARSSRPACVSSSRARRTITSGKSMSGGEIVVRPPAARKFTAHENSIIGNTVLYGATGGILFASGRAGERFAVRNSGGTAVVEGRGRPWLRVHDQRNCRGPRADGRNFGAGMTGGVGLHPRSRGEIRAALSTRNSSASSASPRRTSRLVQQLIYKHLENTESERAKEILADWAALRPQVLEGPSAPARRRSPPRRSPSRRGNRDFRASNRHKSLRTPSPRNRCLSNFCRV